MVIQMSSQKPVTKVAVITGAASGIGLGLARACVDDGLHVVIADLDAGRLGDAADNLRASAQERADTADSDGNSTVVLAQPCDVRKLGDLVALRERAMESFSRVDLACFNAGVGLAKPIAECTEADWSLLFGVNAAGVANGIQAFLPTMIEQGFGHLSATASLSGLIADPDLVIYNGTKFAVVGLLESLALELRRDHPAVGASVLCPGPVATDLVASSAKLLADAGSSFPSDGDEVASYLARGLHPDAVGRLAIDGINAGDFWLLPHPDLTFELVDQRNEAMRSRQLCEPDMVWTQQS